MLFVVSTIFLNLMLMSSFRRVHAKMNSNDFLRRPQHLEASFNVVSEKTSLYVHEQVVLMFRFN